MMTEQIPGRAPTTTEKLTVTGSQLLECAKRLLHQGNIRRIVISQDGRTIAEFPLTIGVVGAVVAPVLAAIGALAALLAECTIEIERVAESPTSEALLSPDQEAVPRHPNDTGSSKA